MTVVDISPRMLALDRQVAAERKLNIQVIEASMDDLSALATASFDVVIQPAGGGEIEIFPGSRLLELSLFKPSLELAVASDGDFSIDE